jgi:uncharacterized metal-binding protein
MDGCSTLACQNEYLEQAKVGATIHLVLSAKFS